MTLRTGADRPRKCGGKMNLRTSRCLLLGLMVTPMLALASPIVGTFGFAGPGVLVFQNGADYIRFCTLADSSCAGVATATGDFRVSGPGTLSFAILLNTD